MSTAAVSQQRVRADDIFFPAVALLILAVVVLGFARSYFLAGMLRAKLPSALVHVHGALFVSWIFFLVIQTCMGAARKIKWHMKFGIVGLVLPPLMVVFGVLTLFGSIRRSEADVPPELLLVGDLVVLALFAVLTSWGLLARRDAASHKRFMILGTMAILGPAIDRWPIPHGGPLGTVCVQLGLPLLIVAYYLWSRRRIHRSTAIAYATTVGGMFMVFPLSRLGFWQQVIAWIRHT